MRARTYRLWLLSIVACASLPAFAPPAQAATNVPCSAPALVAAVDAANAAGGGTLNLAPGCTYELSSPSPNTSFGETGLRISSDITIHGHGATITRALTAPPFRLLIVENAGAGSLALDRVTLTRGLAGESYGGGAILVVSGTSASIERSTLSRNQSRGGAGAVALSSGDVSIDRSVLRDNVAASSGAAVNAFGDLEISQSTFSGNTSRFNGGAIHFYGGEESMSVTTSTFLDNSAAQAGGAIAIGSEGPATISRSTFVGNHGGGSALTTPSVADGFGGGAIYVWNLDPVLVRSSTIVGNVAAGSGGGILGLAGHTQVSGSTIARNVALKGGGLAGGAARVIATVVADNQAPDSPNCIGVIDHGYNLDSGTSCGFSAASGSVSNADPRLGPLADNGGPTQTVALGAGSGAIDLIPPLTADPFTGGSLCAGTTDQRGVARPQGPACDVGAYERVP